jgi:hypothetical protein
MPRYATTALPVVLAATLLMLFPAGVMASAPDSSPMAGASTLAGGSPCTGSLLPHNYTGTVEYNGANAGSSIAVSYTYSAWVTTNLSDGYVLSSVCTLLNGTLTPGPNGAFALSIDPGTNTSCSFPGGGAAGTCVTTQGPYESLNVTPLGSPPPGYVRSVVQNGTTFAIDVYSDLASVDLAPGNASTTYSTSATDELRAIPMSGAGTPSSAEPAFTWGLTGAGWSFLGDPDGPSVNVTAAPGAGIGNLSVVATLSVSGGTLVTPVASEQLVARATEIASASENRTTVDAGQPLGVSFDATGAAGYDYSATVAPGLGVAPSLANCGSTPAAGGSVALACSATIQFPSSGVAQPVVALTNGASSASWTLPYVTVDPAPSVEFLPGLPVGYVDQPMSLELGAGPGTGTAPFLRACLDTGEVVCQNSPGPLWTFRPLFPSVGEFPVRGWIVDATGTNRSATAEVTIVAPPSVAFEPTSVAVAAGTPVAVAVVLSGGDLPARWWANLSEYPTPVATGIAGADGLVNATFVPAGIGVETLTVTAVDRLGTAASASLTFSVGPGTAESVASVGPPVPATVRAGAPFGIDWQALDAVGIPVRAFSSVAEIELALAGSAGAAAGWVNASGYGALSGVAPGWFTVPAGAWVDGALNVSVSVRASGDVRVELALANGFSSANDSVALVVAPDVYHLRLFDPATVRTNDATNDTLWHVSDRFGNPAPGAEVITTATLAGRTTETVSTASPGADGGSVVWVNYTAPSGEGGTVSVTDLAGQDLVPVLVLSAPSAPGSAGLLLLPLAGIAGIALAFGVLALRSRRRAPGSAALDDGGTLQRLAEGRAAVVELVRREGPIDLAGIASVWDSTPPADLADWVASLLTDGTLDARFGDDGVARFVLAVGTGPEHHVTIDVDEFDRGQEARDAARADWGSDEAP